MFRLILIAAIVVFCVLATVSVHFRPDLAIRVATGLVAHELCSKTFTSGLDPKVVMEETLTRSGIRRLAWFLTYRLDRNTKTVSASIVGLLESTAVHRDGLGCVVVHAGHRPRHIAFDRSALTSYAGASAQPPIAGPDMVETTHPAVKAALDVAFEEPPAPPLRRTKAVVVVKDGRIIAERYAAGVGPSTPLMGFSLTKAVANALTGILVRQGRLALQQPAPIAAFRSPSDPRGKITIEHLLRMTSGLDLDETNSGFDRSSRILYLEDDMISAAARAGLVAEPGTRWFYSSPSTLLLSRVLADAVGGQPEDLLRFAWQELFGPLGMRDVTLEFDPSGTWLSSTYMFASARDWARFGLLYLDDGVAGGRRLLPEGWADFSAKSTLGMHYGAGFWTLRSQHAWAKLWADLGIPRDAYFASGDLGQRVIVLPSQRLVIARLGDSVETNGDMPGFARLVSAIVAATKQ